LVADLAPIDMRGRYQGVFSMVWGLGMTLSPIVGGQVMHLLGAPTLWGGCLVMSVLVAGGHLLAARSRRARVAELARLNTT
jgi:MFS family permease